MKKILAAGLFAVSSALAPTVAAAALAYDFRLTLTVTQGDTTCIPELPSWGCTGAVPGDVWSGTFRIGIDPRSVPDGGLSTPFISMRIDTGPFYWAECTTSACWADEKNVLAGYRNLVEWGEDGPGFWVKDGQIIGLAGGFYSGSDVLSLDFDSDFFFPGAGQFFAGGDLPESGAVRGTYTVTQIPEPSSLALLGVGLLGLVGVRRRS